MTEEKCQELHKRFIDDNETLLDDHDYFEMILLIAAQDVLENTSEDEPLELDANERSKLSPLMEK